MGALIAKNLSKSFGKQQVLKGVSLEANAGESVAITGRSGEGKSTLLQILGTLEEPDSGELFIHGKRVESSRYDALRLNHIGFIFQAFHLLEDFTVIENVLMPAKIARQLNKETVKRAESLLEQVGLTASKLKFAKQLSGGEKQRVAIARALMNDPELLFADEPTGNLDLKTAEEIHTLLLSLTTTLKKTLVLVTHSQELANLCSVKLHLSDGALTRDL